MVARGKGWEKRARSGLQALVRAYPDKPEFASLEAESG